METSPKLYTGSPKRDDGREVKQISKISDQIQQQQQQPLSNNIKINGLEKYHFKASEHQMYSSFHEAFGPALTGFLLYSPLSLFIKLNQ